MSWAQWRGEVLETTADEAEIHLHLWVADAGCPRQTWSWNLFQLFGDGSCQASLSVSISNLHLELTDWRELAGREIRADPAWHDAHDYTDEYGRIDAAQVEVSLIRYSEARDSEGRREVAIAAFATGHDFILRFGDRDGFVFPCELDAWLLTKDEYERTEPETPDELSRFADRPPELRVLAPARVSSLSSHISRCPNPAPLARAAFREEVCFDEPNWETTVAWLPRRLPTPKVEFVREAGSPSTVHLRDPGTR